jgi:hypothetical protein
MRRAQVDLGAVTAANTRRIDSLDRTVNGIAGDVTALGRGLAELTGQIRRITTGTADATVTGTEIEPATGEAGPAGETADEVVGQRDWLTVTDARIALDWLVECRGWAEAALVWHDLDLDQTPCWPLHPTVVADVLALIEQRDEAYIGSKPSAVSEWLTRWLPAAVERIRTGLTRCNDSAGHDHRGQVYDARQLTLTDAARWWTGQRDLPPHQALGLARLQ